ncbi:hypothetical protein [Streptomyces sp. NBC_01244]|uniref:hypothetical protein n=1 Tax=Streptomyces sp. NBC_01244 TaxID=2903797 RepID=UPI002E1654D7|nr:hypothetical protein OG247_01985 [Streptomyces sp. NBC_01244]
MTLVTVLILVAVPALIALLALAPNAPVRNNAFPGRPRRRRATHRRTTGPRLPRIPPQHGIQNHAR